MERIVITVDDDEIDITAKSEGGDVETMTASDMESAVSIVRDLLMDATEASDMDDMDEETEDMEASMDEDMDDMDEVADMDEYEKTWNKEAKARQKEREMMDSYQ
tara:strand:+ start:127 stop:441 length:315 start_codon:yes stop_codon:yes gene_type:complete